jgi:hypothetical protein
MKSVSAAASGQRRQLILARLRILIGCRWCVRRERQRQATIEPDELKENLGMDSRAK